MFTADWVIIAKANYLSVKLLRRFVMVHLFTVVAYGFSSQLK